MCENDGGALPDGASACAMGIDCLVCEDCVCPDCHMCYTHHCGCNNCTICNTYLSEDERGYCDKCDEMVCAYCLERNICPWWSPCRERASSTAKTVVVGEKAINI